MREHSTMLIQGDLFHPTAEPKVTARPRPVTAEGALREIAYVLHLTERVKAMMADGAARN